MVSLGSPLQSFELVCAGPSLACYNPASDLDCDLGMLNGSARLGRVVDLGRALPRWVVDLNCAWHGLLVKDALPH